MANDNQKGEIKFSIDADNNNIVYRAESNDSLSWLRKVLPIFGDIINTYALTEGENEYSEGGIVVFGPDYRNNFDLPKLKNAVISGYRNKYVKQKCKSGHHNEKPKEPCVCGCEYCKYYCDQGDAA